ncbi:OB-fold nucleic acid binding domain-containing protein [Halocatena marina]|uniref:OB-fold nucleic acid binding domain-containing protein n=1 Tax=Halocatena marina TaxID=2934937 RepID=A0ABD5YM85_9EURY|nr:OB-fold nucleic acid binding domain-containing protein [Halocatena marina]
MSEQIVTGNSLEDQIGNLHKEDVVLDFAGKRPDQLIVGCYYRGTVDGYADFGVFVNLGEHVTGLLHRSELPTRLESLDWDIGDSVYAQVKNVRDNGNVDLGWSLRRAESEFRGNFVHDPEGTLDPEDLDDSTETAKLQSKPESESESETDDRAMADASVDSRADSVQEAHASEAIVKTEQEQEQGPEPDVERKRAQSSSADLKRAEIEALEENVGNVVRLEGIVTDARQTSGPTVFSLQDETGTVDCAAFEGAGVRAYPGVDAGDYVCIDGEVRERRGELQIETEQLVVLEDEAAATVSDRMEDAIMAEAAVDTVEPLVPDPAVEAVLDTVREAATAIRRAVIESRPIVVRHEATVDGYLAGAAIERAVLPLIKNEQTSADAVYHHFDRRPLDGAYDMDDATNDVTSLLAAHDRHQQKHPLFVFAATGSTRDSLDGFELLRIYDADAIVVDGETGDAAVADAVRTIANPELAGSDAETSSTAIATAIAAHVNTDVRDDLGHLPAASFWENTPDVYADLADERGYNAEETKNLREAIALEAYYQSYDGKRELVSDLLFADDTSGLREKVSEQFREKLAREVETAEENLDRRSEGGVAFAVLDTNSFTHRFDFPSTELLLDEVHRRNRDGTFVTLGVGEDEITIRSTTPVDISDVVQQLEDAVPNAGVTARDGHGRIEFVVGERKRVLEAAIDAIANAV